MCAVGLNIKKKKSRVEMSRMILVKKRNFHRIFSALRAVGIRPFDSRVVVVKRKTKKKQKQITKPSAKTENHGFYGIRTALYPNGIVANFIVDDVPSCRDAFFDFERRTQNYNYSKLSVASHF